MATTLKYTPIDEIESIHASLNAEFLRGRSRNVAFRKQQISQLCWMVQDNTKLFENALLQDLGKPAFEVFISEISPVLKDAVGTYNCLDKWTKPEKAPFTMDNAAMHPKVRREPKGVVLVIAAYNYPMFLTLGPMCSAIAAGNAVVVKASENSPAYSALLAELLPKYLDQSLYRLVNGAVAETSKLLELKWDHILYTGGAKVGQIVATAAAKHLTPVTLELGGKNPTIVDSSANFSVAAKRILWGRFANAGQTCVAPEYILVLEDSRDKLITAFQEAYKSFYPEGGHKSDSFARMATDAHYKRVKSMLDNTQGKVILGGETDEAQRLIAPTVVRDVPAQDSLMNDEIFGPVLPIVTVKTIDEAIAFVNARDHPLALYVFASDNKVKQKVLDNTRSGAGVANDVLLHVGVDGLPFGGVGGSGYGQHTGKWGFDTFTHFRSTLDQPNFVEALMANRYPPYTDKKLKFLTRMLSPRLPPRVGEQPGILTRILSVLRWN